MIYKIRCLLYEIMLPRHGLQFKIALMKLVNNIMPSVIQYYLRLTKDDI